MFSSIVSGAVHGISSYLMQVEVDVSDGLPGFNMVGFMSGEVKEAGERGYILSFYHVNVNTGCHIKKHIRMCIIVMIHKRMCCI